jgi:TctA family transporter
MTEQKERLTLCAEGMLAAATSAVRVSFRSMCSEDLPVWLATVVGRAARSCSRRSLIIACREMALASMSPITRTNLSLTHILSGQFTLCDKYQP